MTLSLAYLSVLAHQRNREQQGRSLRAQALAIQSLIDPVPESLPPTRSEVAAAKRAETIEVAKERWNEEVENAVKWVQRTDWGEVREGLEDRIGSLWDKAFGESIEQSSEKAKDEVKSKAREARVATEDAAGSIASRTRGAFNKTKESSEDFGAKVEEKALQAKLEAWREAKIAENEARHKAAEAQSTISSALEKGKDKAAGVVSKVKAAVGLSGAGAGTAAPAVFVKDVNGDDAVEKALMQRFEKPSSADKRTVAEVLQERYVPMNKRDHSNLRGL